MLINSLSQVCPAKRAKYAFNIRTRSKTGGRANAEPRKIGKGKIESGMSVAITCSVFKIENKYTRLFYVIYYRYEMSSRKPLNVLNSKMSF